MPRIINFTILGQTYAPDYNGLCGAILEANYDQKNWVTAICEDGSEERVFFKSLPMEATWDQITDVSAVIFLRLEEEYEFLAQ